MVSPPRQVMMQQLKKHSLQMDQLRVMVVKIKKVRWWDMKINVNRKNARRTASIMAAYAEGGCAGS